MTPDKRKIVRRDQILTFFKSYYYQWRVSHIMALEKLYNERFQFFCDIGKQTRQGDDVDGKSTIAQEIGNGIYFEAISASVQYIEDLFALLNAGQNPNYFIKNIVTYKAGKIKIIINQENKNEELCKMFYIPYQRKGVNDKNDLAYEECTQALYENIQIVKKYYTQTEFFYNQYKHGLTIALRPHQKYSLVQINEAKKGNRKPVLMAFDNKDISNYRNFYDTPLNGIAILPGLTPDILEHLSELHSENNLIRLAVVPDSIDFPEIVKVSKITRVLLEVFINNFVGAMKEDQTNILLPINEIGKSMFFKLHEKPTTAD